MGAEGAPAAAPAVTAGTVPVPAADPLLVVIAGGGTGGHVLPGLAVARTLAGRGHRVHWVGSWRGMEGRLVPEAGFDLTALPGRGFERRVAAANVVAGWELARAVAGAAALVRRLRPSVVVALGGWASVPCALAAAALRVPLVVMEQNAVPGAANRLTARFAAASAVSFPGTRLPRARLTGNPVRHEIVAADRSLAGREAARQALGVGPGRRLVAVSGGSLGARRLNRAVLEALGAWAGRGDLAVRHVVGRRDWDEMAASVPPLPEGGVQYLPVRYEERMDLLLAAADLVVGRSGGSVAELTAVGVPAVLVPLPGAPGDHQTANGRVLADAGAAVLVPDAELDGDRLVAEVDRLLAEPARLEAMGRAAAAAGRPGAAGAVADLVEECARRG
jgi:undecaprenyldiphospho-muramoylpentapeptide beta-N-acetylglucosaminyltransferase